jgi:hypothetical protein
MVIGLAVASVLEIRRFGVERHQPLKRAVIHHQLDDSSAGGVSTHDVAVLEEVVQQRPGLGVWR